MRYIETEDDLNAWTAGLNGVTRLGVDTEFIGENTYFPVLEIIQINDGKEEAIIDYRAVSRGGEQPARLERLWDVLADPGVETILHHAREDVRILTRLMERPLGRVFDTQLAMSFLDARPQIGYKALVSEVCGARLNKGPQMFDWSRRPLPPDVLRYAIDDVKYLLTLRDDLGERLREAGRWDWYEEEQRTALVEMEPSATSEAWRRVKKGGTLTRRESQVLRHLAQWREELAQRQNTLVSRIMTDDVLVAIARSKPRRLDELARVTRRLTRRQVDLWGADLLECVHRGVEDQLSRDDRQRTHTGRRDDDRTRGLRSLLSAYAEATAARHGLALVRLVKSAEIDEIARDPSAAEDMGLNVLSGWREVAVGHDLLAIARGRLGVTWDAELGRVDVFEFDD